MSDPRLASGMAMRNPRRGKAHLVNPGASYVARDIAIPACGCTRAASGAMTEAVPVAQIAPEDRCRRCWKETP